MGSERLKSTETIASAALDGIAELPRDVRKDASTELRGLVGAIEYVQVVLGQTDSALVVDQRWDSLDNVLTAVRDAAESNPHALQGQADGWRDQLAEAMMGFPIARGRINEARLTDVIKRANDRAGRRIRKLEKRIDEHAERETALTQQLAEKQAELQQYVDARKSEIDEALRSSSSRINDAETKIEAAATSHSDDFRRAQEDRASKFNDALQGSDEKLEELLGDADRRTSRVVDQAEAAMEQATSAAGAYGLKGTAERYRDEADRQARAADAWRWITVVVVLVAVGGAVWAATTNAGNTPLLVGRLGISVVLGALAAYTARQSGRHRDREEDTREISLDLGAFNSFIEPLSSAEGKDDERKALGKRIFGQQLAARNRTRQPGPGFVEQVVQRLREYLPGGSPPAGGSPPGSS